MNYNKSEVYHLLKKYWGYTQFRPLQEEVIAAVIRKEDTLALMPTGGGKSLCFQIPSLYMEGICLVVTPLISLMKDQVAHLNKKNIPALAIHSGMHFREVKKTFENALYGPYKFLYLSPERLQTDLFLDYLRDLPVSLITVDEAHCISQWGYDFRPAYLEIGALRDLLPEVPLLAITATATLTVRTDIQEKLRFRKPQVLLKSFFRENLSYSVFKEANKPEKLRNILTKVPGSSIVFCRSRKRTQDLTKQLNDFGFDADYYHAGLTNKLRNQKQENWIKGEIRIIVCTNAFGMGIDKPDVRTVIHYDIPESPEAYYQEAGRAGRDGQRAYAVLLYNDNELEHLLQSVVWQFPSLKKIREIYRGIVSYLQVPAGSGADLFFDFNLKDFCEKFNQKIRQVAAVLKLLEQEGHLYFTESIFLRSKISFHISKNRLYEFEKHHPSLTPLIQTLLRTREGIFNDYVAVDEKQIARLLKRSYKKVIEQLLHLQRMGILYYIPQKNSPQICFTEERARVDHLPVNMKYVAQRKRAYEKRIHAIITYAKKTTTCRSRMLLSYFHETESSDCGICDVCIRKKKQQQKTATPNQLYQEIKHKVISHPVTSRALLNSYSSTQKGFVEAALRQLLDEEIISIGEDNRLIWNG